MKIGVPAEVKNNENRVGLTPNSVKYLSNLGHSIYVQSKAGDSIGFSDNLYRESGAIILEEAGEVFENANLIIKVKEPQENELKLINSDHIVFTFFHFETTRHDLIVFSF